MDANGATINTALVDCGTATGTARSRRPVGPHRPSPALQGEAAECAGCHENPKQAFIAQEWAQSKHANSYGVSQGNTFCAQCHAPFQADASATATTNQPIAIEQWQGVTCTVCHPPADKMAEWGTPIALYDVATRTYTPLALADANLLCLNCHNGQFAPGLGDAGLVMLKDGVRCIDCHMANVASGISHAGDAAAHDFKVATNLPKSCGIVAGGCHAGGTVEWAQGEIQSGAIHGTP